MNSLQITEPPPLFEEVVKRHFSVKRDAILKQCEDWVNEATEGKTALTLTVSLRLIWHHLQHARRSGSGQAGTGVRDTQAILNDEALHLVSPTRHYYRKRQGIEL